MARVFRHTYTKRLPDGRREKRTCAKWYIELTEATGRVRRVPGYVDKRATEAYANELQRRVDRERAGIIDTESVELSRELSASIEKHIEVYRTHLQASEVSEWHLSETTRRLRRIVQDCGFARLLDIRAEAVQRWITLRNAEGMGARTLNTYTGSLRAFVRWCMADRRMASDPLVTLSKADEKADVRRERRVLSEAEFIELLTAAERRPLVDALTIRRGRRKGELSAKVEPQRRAQLERLGRERRLVYMTLVLTGLRRGELAGLTWADVSLDDADGQAWLTVRACERRQEREERDAAHPGRPGERVTDVAGRLREPVGLGLRVQRTEAACEYSWARPTGCGHRPERRGRAFVTAYDGDTPCQGGRTCADGSEPHAAFGYPAHAGGLHGPAFARYGCGA